jgi:hypothetical protein
MKLLNDILEANMTDDGFKFWKALESKIPSVWSRFTSSTKKYHLKSNGYVPTIAEHTYEMLYAAVPLLRMFDISAKTRESDMILLSVVLHDSFKYGTSPNSVFAMYTDKAHDKVTADIIHENKEVFGRIFSDEQFKILEEAVRYHSGRWSTDAKGKDFTFQGLRPFTFFLHMLDMLSSRDLLKVKNGD